MIGKCSNTCIVSYTVQKKYIIVKYPLWLWNKCCLHATCFYLTHKKLKYFWYGIQFSKAHLWYREVNLSKLCLYCNVCSCVDGRSYALIKHLVFVGLKSRFERLTMNLKSSCNNTKQVKLHFPKWFLNIVLNIFERIEYNRTTETILIILNHLFLFFIF